MGSCSNGSTAGIGNPNSQNTTVTTKRHKTILLQQLMLIILDVSLGIVNVTGSGGSWDFSTISPNPACEGDCIDLNFTSTSGVGNYNITIEMIDRMVLHLIYLLLTIMEIMLLLETQLVYVLQLQPPFLQ